MEGSNRALLDRFVQLNDAAGRKALFERERTTITDRWLGAALDDAMALAGKARVDEALIIIDRVEELARHAGNANRAAGAMYSRGNVLLYRKGDREGARKAFEEALAEYRKSGNVRGEANTLSILGETAFWAKDYRRARELNEKAVELFRSSGEAIGEANALFRLGDIAFYSGNSSLASDYFEKAVVIYRRVGSLLGEANYVMKTGEIAAGKLQLKDAAARYREGIAMYRRAGSVHGEANGSYLLGMLFYEMSEFQEARDRLERALEMYRGIGLHAGIANCIQKLGDIYFYTSNMKKALAFYEEALGQHRKYGDAIGEAECVRGLASVSVQTGDYQIARIQFAKALELYRRSGSAIGEANCLWGMGNVELYHEENYAKAAEFYTMAAALYKKGGFPGGEGNCYKRLGEAALRKSEDVKKAEGLFDGAVPLYRKAGDILGEANCIKDLGLCAFIRKDYRKAAENTLKASTVFRRLGIFTTLYQSEMIRSRALFALGDIDGARKALESALDALLRARDDSGSESVRLHMQELAGHTIKDAIADIATRDPEFALDIFERFRGRSFLESMKGHAALAASGIGEKDLARWRELFDRRVLSSMKLKRLYEAPNGEKDRAAALDEYNRCERELEAFEADLMMRYEKYRSLREEGGSPVKTRGALAEGETAALFIMANAQAGVWLVTAKGARYRTLKMKPADIVARVEEYRSYVVGSGFNHGERTASGKGARALADLSTVAGEALGDVPAGSKIVIVPDGVLGLLPWESLTVRGKLLSPEYTLSYAPNLGVLSLLRRRDYSGLRRVPLIVFGGAYYERGSGTVRKEAAALDPMARIAALEKIMTRGFREEDLADLPGAEEEAKRTAALYYHEAKDRDAALFMKAWASESVLKALDRGLAGDKAIGGRGIRLADARVLHFAVHGRAEADFPETSRIVLSRPGAIPAGELKSMEAAFPLFSREDGSLLAAEIVGLTVRADLVVLSACETGVGRVTSTEGIVGLTRSWMVAGANGVVVSLWEVSDIGTRIYMTHLHRLLAAGTTPREAVGQAREMLRTGAWRSGEFAPGNTYDDEGEKVPFGKLDLSSPFFWAAFQYWGK